MTFLAPLLLLLFAESAISQCPEWAQHSPITEKCYEFIDVALSFADAGKICRHTGGRLVSVHSAFEQKFIFSSAMDLIDDYWMGGDDSEQMGVWMWTDGSNFDFTNWAPGSPNYQGNKRCLSGRKASGHWFEESCAERRPFICETDPSQPTTGHCEDGWKYFNKTNACYKVVEGFTVSNSERACRNMNAALTSIHSNEENEFIKNLFPTIDQIAIGLYTVPPYVEQTAIYFWSDGSPLDYINWTQNEPHGNFYCSFILPQSNGQWQSHGCDLQKPGVCKKPSEKQRVAKLASKVN